MKLGSLSQLVILSMVFSLINKEYIIYLFEICGVKGGETLYALGMLENTWARWLPKNAS